MDLSLNQNSGGGCAKCVTTRAGGRPDDNFIIEQRNAIRENDRLCDDHTGEGQQGFRQSSDDGSDRASCADGVLLGKSPSYQRGLLTDPSRTIDTQGKNGVVEWKK